MAMERVRQRKSVRQEGVPRGSRTRRKFRQAGAELFNPSSQMKGRRQNGLAAALGWFSIGLGLIEVTLPRRMAGLIGAPTHHHPFMRGMGFREIASGISILIPGTSTGGVWSRIGGDAIDLAYLGTALLSGASRPSRLMLTGAAVAGVTLLDVLCAQQRTSSARENGAQAVAVRLAINRSPEDLYRFWHDFQNLPRFMKHLKTVMITDDRRSHWVAEGPAGTTVEWDAEIIEDRINEAISWRSLEGSEVSHTGSIDFKRAPGKGGTFVTVKMEYRPPGGTLGSTIAWLFGEEPNQTIKADLRRFKQLMETGEVVTTEGQPAGRPSSTSWKYDQAARS